MGVSRDNNPFDIIPYIVYIISSPKSWTIVANNRTIFTFLPTCAPTKTQDCAYCTISCLPFYTFCQKGSATEVADPFAYFL